MHHAFRHVQVEAARLKIPANVRFVDMALLQKGTAHLALLLSHQDGGWGGSIGMLPLGALQFSNVPPPTSCVQEVIFLRWEIAARMQMTGWRPIHLIFQDLADLWCTLWPDLMSVP